MNQLAYACQFYVSKAHWHLSETYYKIGDLDLICHSHLVKLACNIAFAVSKCNPNSCQQCILELIISLSLQISDLDLFSHDHMIILLTLMKDWKCQIPVSYVFWNKPETSWKQVNLIYFVIVTKSICRVCDVGH